MADVTNKVSLSPDDAAMGLIDDFDGVLISMRAVTFDYQGKAEPVPAIAMTVKPDGDEDEFTDYYKIGDLKTFLPTPDGFSFTAITEKRKKISVKSKGMILMKSLADAGFDKEKLRTGDVNVADGQRFHFVRIEAPEYKDFERKPKKLGPDGKPYKDTFLVFEKWLKEEGQAAGATAGATTQAPASEPDVNLEIVKIATSSMVGEIIAAAGGKIDQKAMAGIAYKKMAANDPNRNVMLTLLMKPDFLKEYFNLDNGILSKKA